jgi:hypothetical protein
VTYLGKKLNHRRNSIFLNIVEKSWAIFCYDLKLLMNLLEKFYAFNLFTNIMNPDDSYCTSAFSISICIADIVERLGL